MALAEPRLSTRRAAPVSADTRFATLRVRRRRPERMDQPDLDPAEHARALRGLGRVNQLSGAVSALWRPIGALEPAPARPLRVLDVASGGGDNAVALARRAGRALEVAGCDISPVAVACAQRAADRAGAAVHFFEHDALREPFPEGYDVVMCSLFLHHLDEEQAVGVLRRMAAAARRLVLVDDLIRSRLGYVLAWVGCRVLSRSPVVHYDGPTSVAAAFRPDEAAVLAERAGLHAVSIVRHWPERFLLSGRPS